MKKVLSLILNITILVFISGCIHKQEITTIVEDNTLLNVYFIDVNQGDAILIRYKDINILIDAGENDREDFMVNYLNHLGINKLDYVIGTHPDSDHIGGLDAVINAFIVDNIIDSGVIVNTKTYLDYMDAINREVGDGTGSLIYDMDQKITLDENLYLQIIETKDDFSDNNNNSVIAYLVYNEIEFFLTGDMENEAEDYLINRIKNENLDIHADVLKAAHHGSKYSSKDDFLNYINPKFVVISAGYNNKYGLPTQEAISRFERYTDDIFITYESCPNENDFCSIIASTDGVSVNFNTNPIVIPDLSKSVNMSFENIINTVRRGNTFSINVLGEANTLYDIDLVLPSGTTSNSKYLIDKLSSSSGKVSWSYTFSSNSTLGTGKVIVKNKITSEEIILYYELKA